MKHSLETSHFASAAQAHLDRGFRFEQGGTLERALEAYHEAIRVDPSPRTQAEAHLRIARIHRTRADWADSTEEANLAIQLAEQIGDDDLVAEAMNIEVGALQIQGKYEQADALAARAIDRARSPRVRGITLQMLGTSAAERRDFETADRHFAASIAAFRLANYDLGLAVALANAAKVALDRGDPYQSIEIGHEGVSLCRRLNALDILLTTVQNQAAALVAIGNLQSAEDLLTEALGHFTSARNLVRQAECLEIMGEISERRPDRETATRCYARATELAMSAGDAPLVDRLKKRLAAVSGGTSSEDRGER